MNFYSLGIVLFLGHDGVPCPLTVEVCLYWHLYWHHQFCSVMTLYITIRARRWSSWASCPESWVHPSHFPCGPWPLPPHYCTIPRTFRDCPQPCLSHWWSILPRGPIMYALQSWAIPTSLWSTTQAYLTWRYCIAFAPMLWRKMRADECLALSFKLQAYQLLLCWMTFWWTIWSARPQHNSTIQSFKA